MSTAEEEEKESTRQCKAALQKNEKQLSKLKSVVGLGIVPAEAKAGKMAVAIYVKSLPDKDDPKAEPIPEFLEFTDAGTRRRVPTKLVELGEPFFESESEAF